MKIKPIIYGIKFGLRCGSSTIAKFVVRVEVCVWAGVGARVRVRFGPSVRVGAKNRVGDAVKVRMSKFQQCISFRQY